MKKKKLFPSLVALNSLALFLAFSPRSQAQIVTNGNFSANASSYVTYPSYDTYGTTYMGQSYVNPESPTGWTPIDGQIGVGGADTLSGNSSVPGQSPNNVFGPSSSIIDTPSLTSTKTSVSNYIILQSGTRGAAKVTQVVALAANTDYILTFAVAIRGGSSAAVPHVTLGNGVANLIDDTSISLNGSNTFVLNSVHFTTGSVAGSETLILENNETSTDTTVDFSNVTIAAVAVP